MIGRFFVLLPMGLGLLAVPASPQWINVPPVKAPRAKSGEIDLKAPTPRRPDGKPDLSGSWSPDDNRYVRDFALDMKPEDVPYLPWAKKLFDERKDGAHSGEDPDAHCLPQGVPKVDSVQYPCKVVYTSNSIAIIYDTFNYWR